MATSNSDLYVWAWLPGANEPVPAGALRARDGSGLSFRYGKTYRERVDAPELLFTPHPSPERKHSGWYAPTENLGLPAALRDASPDNWGRRVIINRVYGASALGDTGLLTERDYLIRSGSNRLGNLDFQLSPTVYEPRVERASLDELYTAAELVEEGTPLPDSLRDALLAGTAIGGARPKALLSEGPRDYIAKFSTTDDAFDVVGAEAASMFLAERAGLPVVDCRVVRSMGRKAIVMARFDRPGDGTRRGVVSGLTMLGAPETFIPVGSYPALIDQLVMHASDAKGIREQMFRRVAFNVIIGNTDDHLRNHAAFWDGEHLNLTPAYDLSPVLRAGEETQQALPYGRDGERRSNLSILIAHAADYGLSRPDAAAITEEMVAAVREHWDDAAEFAELSVIDRTALWGRAFLNPGILHDLSDAPPAPLSLRRRPTR